MARVVDTEYSTSSKLANFHDRHRFVNARVQHNSSLVHAHRVKKPPYIREVVDKKKLRQEIIRALCAH